MAERLKVAIVMGSDSDYDVVKEAVEVLEEFHVHCDVLVISAHRSPELAHRFAKEARPSGYGVLIAAAGGAAHLAGVLASLTTLPVIGIPIAGSALSGLDALYATVQMPAGVPVATMAIGKAGARNAAILAVQILAIGDAELAAALEAMKAGLAKKVEAANHRIQQIRREQKGA